MKKKVISAVHQSTFESIRRVNQRGQDFWSARELYQILGYLEYRNFLPVIEKAKQACLNSKQSLEDHFVDVHEMVDIDSNAKRKIGILFNFLTFSTPEVAEVRKI